MKLLSSHSFLLVFLMAFLCHPKVSAQGNATKEITGIVIAENDLPLIGATVIVKGTQKGAITTEEGKFILSATENDILVITMIGYASQEILVGDQTRIEVKMEEAITSLEEVVVVFRQ